MTTHQPGDEIAGYRIEALLGRGGMAVVYRAEDTRLGRKVALKLLTPQLADHEEFRQRFIRESRLAASLDHPNIVPVYEAGEAGRELFIAMRFVLGGDLKRLLAAHPGPLPADQVLGIAAQVGDALDTAHAAGLVHRDVKPANVLIAAGGGSRRAHVYLSDFGLTKRTLDSRRLTGAGHFLGTIGYISPEQIQGRSVGPRTDIYALGCVLHECLTGSPPFRRDDDAALLWAHLVEAPPPVTGVRPELSPAVDAVVARAMAKDPADRYASCEELTRALGAALAVPVQVPVAGRPAASRTAPLPTAGPPGYGLAVDLGTSFVAAAVADDHGVEMVELGDGELVAPAAVYVAGDGRVLAGAAAARRGVSRPDRFAGEVKRHLGRSAPLVLGGVPHPATDLLAALLADVLARVTARRGAPAEVTLTHPATWGPARRGLLEDVARTAGLDRPVLTTEPEAAAVHHVATRPLREGELLAVYDLGGGTFDATVLRRTAGGFEPVGTPVGIEGLGGSAFDDAVLAHVDRLCGGALAGLDPGDPRTAVDLARLRRECTLAKEALSVDVEAVVPVLLPHRHVEVTVTRADLEALVRAPVEATIRALDRLLGTAGVDRSAVAAVLLVGGSSRIPLVGRRVAEAFGRPVVLGPHPKHPVALGAALLAGARRRTRR